MGSNLFPANEDESPMYHILVAKIESSYDPKMHGMLCVLAMHEGSLKDVTGAVDERVAVFDSGDADLVRLEGCVLKVSESAYGIMGGRWVLETDTIVRVDDDLVDAYEDL